MALLDVRHLTAGYRHGPVIEDVDVALEEGEVLAVLGRNGAGKTTLLSSIMGLVRPMAGRVSFAGHDLTGRRPDVAARAGLALVPQGRRLFGPLTVEEHLRLAARCGRDGDWTLEAVYHLLPSLAERRRHLATQLSGGEQQMLSIGRALLTNPRLLLTDEPSDGLAPVVVQRVGTIIRTLTAKGCSMVLVEQDLALALSTATHVAVMEKGRIVHRAPVDTFRRDPVAARRLLGIG